MVDSTKICSTHTLFMFKTKEDMERCIFSRLPEGAVILKRKEGNLNALKYVLGANNELEREEQVFDEGLQSKNCDAKFITSQCIWNTMHCYVDYAFVNQNACQLSDKRTEQLRELYRKRQKGDFRREKEEE
jgi:hypothetical protein